MPVSLQSKLENIFRKIKRIEDEREQLRERCRMLEEKNGDLQRELGATRKELDKALMDAEFLTLSHRLADDPDTIIDARRKISSLIRRVDKAIRLATDDPSL